MKTKRIPMTTFTRFAIVGALTAGLYFGILYVFAVVLQQSKLLSFVVAYIPGVLFNYCSHYYWTYGATAPHASCLPRYVFFGLLLMGINAAVAELYEGMTGFGFFVLQCALWGGILLATFAAQKLVIFRR